MIRSFYSNIWFDRPYVANLNSKFRIYDGHRPEYIEVQITSPLWPGENKRVRCKFEEIKCRFEQTRPLLQTNTCFELIKGRDSIGKGIVLWVDCPSILYCLPLYKEYDYNVESDPLNKKLRLLSRVQDNLYAKLYRGLSYIQLYGNNYYH